jgi:hypothetical protein
MGYNNDAMGYIRGYMMGYIMGYTVTNDDLRSVRGDRRPRQCHRWPNQYAMAQHRAEPIGDQAAKASHTAAVEKPLPWSLRIKQVLRHIVGPPQPHWKSSFQGSYHMYVYTYIYLFIYYFIYLFILFILFI